MLFYRIPGIYMETISTEGVPPAEFAFEYENVAPLTKVNYTGKELTAPDPVFENKKMSIYQGTVSFLQEIKIEGTIPQTLKGNITIYTGKGNEFYPVEQPFDIALEGGMQAEADVASLKIPAIDTNNPVADCGQQKNTQSSLWGIFFLGFLGGIIALLTPCVFPMIPVTVSFFTKRSANRKIAVRNGILYGLFIFLIYILVSVPFHIAGNVNPEIFNTISTNAYLNILFFVIFIFFAISFFGYFDITLPGSIANRADEKSSLGSIGGIFFMSLTLAIVSFSCTGPILGSLLVGSLSGGVWDLTIGLAGFGIALALPFTLFAIFPNWLHSLPKSGGWLDTVKKILAFLELGFAFKFLSNADLVMHWGLLKREVFIGIWILISLGLTAYLFGLLRLPHDYKGQKISITRKVLGVIAFLFTIYLIPGLTQTKYANLSLISGFPPPLTYSLYEKSGKNEHSLEADVVNDYEKALQMAKEQNKPLLIDFTGWACVNCRKMEENVWTQPEVYDYIKANFILVSLYVDDRGKLPVEQRITYVTKDNNSKELITIGDKWQTFEAENFNQVSQPLYAIINPQQKLLNNPVGYTAKCERVS